MKEENNMGNSRINSLVVSIFLLLFSATIVMGGGDEEADNIFTDSFILGNGAEPETLDPHLMSGVPEHRINMGMFEGLVTVDPETALPVPGVAESWEISADGTVYTFKLRDAEWSDGTPITAQDFVYGWLRILNPETAAGYAWFPSSIIKGANEYNSGEAGPEVVQVRALDDKTFQFETVGPAPYTVKALTHYSFQAVPAHTVEEFGPDWTRPENIVSNGPYILKEWKPQEYILLEKNDRYWDPDKALVERVIFYPVEQESTMYAMYQNDEMNWATNVPQDQLDVARTRSDFQINPQLATYYYVFNAKKAPMDDARVRKALSLALDRQVLVDQVTRAGQQPAFGIVPPMAGYTPIKGLGYDIAEAQRLLAEAGYPNGEGFPEIELLYNTSEGHKRIGEFVQEQWKQALGIDIALRNEEWKTYLNSRDEAEYDVARAGWVGDYNDPDTFLQMFKTGSGHDGYVYGNSEFDRLVDLSLRTSDETERMQVLHDAELILIESDQAIMPLYFYVTMNMIDLDQWDGWYKNVMDYHPVGNVASY